MLDPAIHRAVIEIGCNRDEGLTGSFFYGTGRKGGARLRLGQKLRFKSRAAVVPEELNALLHLANNVRLEHKLMFLRQILAPT